MVTLDSGLNKIRDVHASNIDKGWLGTAGTAIDPVNQTGLQSGVTTAKLDITITKTDKTNVINYTLPSTTATALTYREFAYLLDGDTEYDRVVFTGFEHTENDDIIVRTTVRYKRP